MVYSETNGALRIGTLAPTRERLQMAGLRQKIDLLRGLLDGETARTGPLYVDVDVTSRCNLSCVGCFYHSPEVEDDERHDPVKGDIPLDLAKELFSDLRKMGTNSIILQGAGEPLLYPNLLELISFAKQNGFDVMVLTNGTLLGREMCEGLIESHLDTLRVSLWASSSGQYQLNYPGNRPGLFEKTVEGIRRVVRIKGEVQSAVPRIVLYHPINRTNFETIERFVDLGLDIPVDGLTFAPMNTVRDSLAHLALTEDERDGVLAQLRKLRTRFDRLSIDHNIDEVLLRYDLGEKWWQDMPCYTTWFHARFRIDGNIQPCGRCDPSLSLGNFSQDPFQKIWNGPAFRSFRRQARSRPGMESLRRSCDCDYCCYVKDMSRIHRVLKWLPASISNLSRMPEWVGVPKAK